MWQKGRKVHSAKVQKCLENSRISIMYLIISFSLGAGDVNALGLRCFFQSKYFNWHNMVYEFMLLKKHSNSQLYLHHQYSHQSNILSHYMTHILNRVMSCKSGWTTSLCLQRTCMVYQMPRHQCTGIQSMLRRTNNSHIIKLDNITSTCISLYKHELLW